MTFLFACFEQLYGHPVGITEMAHKTGCGLAAQLLLSEGRSAPDTWQMTGPSPDACLWVFIKQVYCCSGGFLNYFNYTALSQSQLYVVSHCHSHSSFILTTPLSHLNSGTLRSELNILSCLLPPLMNKNFLLRHQYNLHQEGRMDRFGEAGLAAHPHWGQTNHVFWELFCSPHS